MGRNGYNKIICLILLILSGASIMLSFFVFMNLFQMKEAAAVTVRYMALFVLVLLILLFTFVLILWGRIKEITLKAYTDVTGINNKKSLEKKLKELEEQDATLDIGIMMFDLNNLKVINDTYGHDKGDEFIRSFASCLTRVLTQNSFLARFGGDEFMIVQEQTSMEELSQMADRLQKQINDYNKYTSYPISYAVGYDVSYKNHYFLINDLIQEVDKKMYQDKQYRKSRTGSLVISSTNVIINQMNAIMKAGAPETKYVLTMTDIAKFNLINAIYGYSMGNEILNAVSMEIDRFPNTIETFRVYSDVFISIVAIGAQFEKDILKRIADCNRKVADVVASQFSVDYFVLNTGIYKIGANAVDEKTVFNVSAALQEAKKNTEHICTYSQKIGQKKLFQAEILNSFWNAMNNDEFELYIQPKISAQTEQIHSAEALVRWCRNGKILYFPDQFIPLLEKSGDIIELDFHMCEKVFQWLHQRETIQEKVMPISVNISTEHFYKPDRLIEKINELQQQYPIQPEHLIFEITETAYISHLDAVNDIIDRLHQQGFRVSMDDFGSGYSSLNTLQDVRFDEIKIDKQFLANGLTFNGKIVLQEIFHMLKRMHKTIVCEGVETKEAIDFLVEINCDEMQGYYYYKPMPIQEFEQIIL